MRKLKVLVVIIMLAILVSIFVGISQAEELTEKIEVKVMMFAMFEVGKNMGDDPGEFQFWYEEYWPEGKSVEVEGASNPVFYNDNGVCGSVIGWGKLDAATSVMAILSDSQFDFSEAYFITSGCAGTPPSVGTLGAVFWADWVVDYDLGHRWSPKEGIPCWMPFGGECEYGWDLTTAGNWGYKLNEDLVVWAYDISKDVELIDSEEAKNYRMLYTEEAARRKPFVGIGTVMCGDCYFHGPGLSKEAKYICDFYGTSTYSATTVEDVGSATALFKKGYLGRYLVIRDIVNFDQPHPGQTTQESLMATSGGFILGMVNGYRVGTVVVDHIIQNWDTWKYGVPRPVD